MTALVKQAGDLNLRRQAAVGEFGAKHGRRPLPPYPLAAETRLIDPPSSL